MPSAPDHRASGPCRDLSDLLADVLDGHRDAWSELVARFDPLVTTILRRYRLSPGDLPDVRQDVWACVIVHVRDLREPHAFPGWIAAVTRHEATRWCSAVRRRGEPTDSLLIGDIVRDTTGQVPPVDDNLVRTEIRRSVRSGLQELPVGDRELMLLLFGDDELSYREISRTLGIPPGRIGPTRARCLRKLRRSRAMADLVA